MVKIHHKGNNGRVGIACIYLMYYLWAKFKLFRLPSFYNGPTSQATGLMQRRHGQSCRNSCGVLIFIFLCAGQETGLTLSFILTTIMGVHQLWKARWYNTWKLPGANIPFAAYTANFRNQVFQGTCYPRGVWRFTSWDRDNCSWHRCKVNTSLLKH